MSVGRAAAILVGVVVVGAGLWFLRSASISRDVEVAAGSRTEVVYGVTTRQLEEHTVAEAASALFQACRMTVEARVVQPPTDIGTDVYRAVFAPALDRTDRLQLRGCLEDLQIAHVLGDVLRVGRVEPHVPAPRSRPDGHR